MRGKKRKLWTWGFLNNPGFYILAIIMYFASILAKTMSPLMIITIPFWLALIYNMLYQTTFQEGYHIWLPQKKKKRIKKHWESTRKEKTDDWE